MKVAFNGKILVIGCGYVSRCTVPLLIKHLDMPASNITIMDFVDNREAVKGPLEKGAKYVVDRITKDNMAIKLNEYVGSGDLIVDLAWNIDCCEILQWCHDKNVRYINTSVEEWDPYENAENKTPQERTLYHRHMLIREMKNSWSKKGPTAVIEHGANPGLVSHFTKVSLRDIALKIIKDKPTDPRSKILPGLITAGDFAKIAQLTGTKVIHVSERDLQVTDKPKQPNEFVNTWSIEGFYEEGIAPAEMGWGTHEKTLPANAQTHKTGPQNQICLSQMGMKTKVHSWVPFGETVGMVVRHGEAFTISDYLTVWDNNKALYRPTVHYAYCCCDAALASLNELEMRSFKLQEKQRIMTDEIISGRDELGVLLMGHDFKSWWCGSLLDIEESRKLVPHQNPTTLQVASSVLGAIFWMIKNPFEGVCVPDDLPYEEILETAKPYLGPLVSKDSDWTPVKNRRELFGKPNKQYTEEEIWQFSTFLIS